MAPSNRLVLILSLLILLMALPADACKHHAAPKQLRVTESMPPDLQSPNDLPPVNTASCGREKPTRPVSGTQIGFIAALAGSVIALRRQRANMWMISAVVGCFCALLGYIWTMG